MSEQVHMSNTPRHGVGRAVAGVVFADFIGGLLFWLPSVGWLLGLATMFLGSPEVAWLSLECHPRRRAVALQIGISNAAILIAAGFGLFVLALAALDGLEMGF